MEGSVVLIFEVRSLAQDEQKQSNGTRWHYNKDQQHWMDKINKMVNEMSGKITDLSPSNECKLH